MREEQIDKLVGLIQKNGFATVKFLASATYTSPSTIRRQLAELQRMGLIQRSYGGAELIRSNVNTPIELRLQKNHRAKDMIARKAAELVSENSTVFIDGSSTCLHMAPYLEHKKGLVVYTYGAELCQLLSELDIPTFCLGGRYDRLSKNFSGEWAVKMAQSVYFDAFFFSSSGFCDGKVYDYSEAETHLRRALLPQSRKSYFLCDREKVGKRSTHILCSENELTAVLTEN